MSSASPAEFSAATIIARIEANEYPPQVLETIANGFLPLPQADLIAVLAFLAQGGDAAIAEAARRSLHDIPMRSVAAFASDESAPPAHLALLARATDDATILEALIRNRAIDDAVVVNLAAATADPVVQEVIVINQTRILRAPQILDALLENPRISTDVRRRALETREEFFEKKARRAEEEAEADESEIADLLAKAEEEDAAVPPPPQSLPDLSAVEANNPESSSVWTKILKMTVAEKVRYAFRADKTARMVLIRDRNKLVCTAVMRNPRVTETELEGIAGMRNIDEEVLRLIGTRRGWMAKYTIMTALCRNPKAPVGVVLPLVNRLTLRDLKSLKDDRGVSEVVRTMAKKLFIQRSQKS
jgi:hypothetical protein